jgi:hypothetical protein
LRKKKTRVKKYGEKKKLFGNLRDKFSLWLFAVILSIWELFGARISASRTY